MSVSRFRTVALRDLEARSTLKELPGSGLRATIPLHSRLPGYFGSMAAMLIESESQAEQRRALLDPVAQICERASISVTCGQLNPPVPRGGPAVVGMLCAADDGSWDAMLTVVRGQRIPVELQPYNGPWCRDPYAGYDLTSAGNLLYELQIHEDDDGGTGHGPRPIVVYKLFEQAEAAADALIQWWQRPARFRVPPPVPDQRARQRRSARIAEHRRTTSASPRVRFDDAALAGAADVAAIDPATLALHFPRGRGGGFLRSAVVALASLDGAPPHVRSRWLAVRAKGDELHVGVEDLIGGNQLYRWNLTPWMWDRRRADTPARDRWQLDDAAQARPYLDALVAGRVTEALDLARVAVDAQLAKLLRGEPTRNYRAELTGKWVGSLYAGLTESAPWRFAAAYAAWLAERGGRPKPAPMFGLKGLGQARKPIVVLDRIPSAIILRLEFSGSNFVLPSALWTIPADLS
jgi:hypothetical protein